MFIGLTWLAWVDMKLVQHYRILGLRRNASFSDVKKAYRQLVRKYHPDVNQDKAAVDRFIKINESYTVLCDALQGDADSVAISSSSSQYVSVETSTSERLNLDDLKRKLEKLGIGNFQASQQPQNSGPETPPSQHTTTTASSDSTREKKAGVHASDKPKNKQKQQQTQQFANSASISEQDLNLKKEAYEQLKILLRQQKFPRAIALVEGLAQRMPTDLEINQWQAIVYQRWGRQLISQGQFQKARIYLRKALQTDPNNPSLTKEVDRDLGLLKHLQAVEATL